eukprot:gb/GECG01016763.1/.p1 GENE.gb/GECG01016763.1/~~gb/GECG01016763.1/.p1  ORF type:complete len:459 (+),score=85.55 gb/GECG01016763.1/:1-1377(+)
MPLQNSGKGRSKQDEDSDEAASVADSISSDEGEDRNTRRSTTQSPGRTAQQRSPQKQNTKSKEEDAVLSESTMQSLKRYLNTRKGTAKEQSLSASLTRGGLSQKNYSPENTIHRSWRGIDSLSIDRSLSLNRVGSAGASFRIIPEPPSRDDVPNSVRVRATGPEFEKIVNSARIARGEISEYNDDTLSDDEDKTVEEILQNTTLKQKYHDALNRLSQLSQPPKDKYAMESEKTNCLFAPIMSKASKRAIKKIKQSEGHQSFLDRMENQEKQRLINLQQQARQLEKFRGTKEKKGKTWEKVANDFFERLEKFERDREENLRKRREEGVVIPVPRKEKIDPTTKETITKQFNQPNWKEVRDDFFHRMEEDKEKRSKKENEALEKMLENSPVYTFKPQVNVGPKYAEKLGTFEERHEKDLEKRRERIRQHEKEVQKSQEWLENGVIRRSKSAKKSKKKSKK